MTGPNSPGLLRRIAAAVERVYRSDHGVVVFAREVLSSALVVAVVGLLLFGVSGLWPPLVAVESGSMQPHIQKGDLVFVTEEHRFSPDSAYGDTGVVTYRVGERADYRTFHEYGDVVVYERDGRSRTTPVIHRARFWVNDGENWYDEADARYVEGARNCSELTYCPAPHAGFITKGDHNGYYDQADGISSPVRPSWVRGTAELRLPWLGRIRLLFSGATLSASTPV
ncbi:S24/S26 family peptidase [Halocalculus aciditolerans]|uniref:S26 family signal peptidase n=1 Tax=Halocalculus aciditolerans TaxID=1383812 RepID=A0A830F2A4_9EURY|nr:S26 family signal peptidase [Halocalculus aciditolerans]GGL55452.1 S26 family signal peptidase [Halocalculus aciditolerans]